MMTAMLTVENIVAGSRVFNIWNVNEDAEYHESGKEGQRVEISSYTTEAALTEGQAAALKSEREVPQRIEAAKSKKAA